MSPEYTLPCPLPPGRIGIKEVAAKAGVHYSTVSLALRGHPRISAKTRTAITLAARELGYQQTAVMHALTARRTGLSAAASRPRILFLTNRKDQRELFNTPHMRLFVDGARQKSEQLGFDFDVFLCGDTACGDAELQQRLDSANPAGVVVGALVDRGRPLALDFRGKPVVRIDSAFALQNTPMVSNDQLQIVGSACENLHALGYRRIGLAVGRIDEENTDNRFSAGYLLACERLRLKRLAPFLFEFGSDDVSNAGHIRTWIRREKPEVVTSNWGSLEKMLQLAGFRVPQDLAAACLCLSAPSRRLAGMIQGHFAVGRKAVESLAIDIEHRSRSLPTLATRFLVEGQWNPGRSAPRKQ